MNDPILTVKDIIKITECCKLCEWLNNHINEYPCIICSKNPIVENYFQRKEEGVDDDYQINQENSF